MPLKHMADLYSDSEDENLPLTKFQETSAFESDSEEDFPLVNFVKPGEKILQKEDSEDELPVAEFVKQRPTVVSSELSELLKTQESPITVSDEQSQEYRDKVNTSLNDDIPLKAFIDQDESFSDDEPLQSFVDPDSSFGENLPLSSLALNGNGKSESNIFQKKPKICSPSLPTIVEDREDAVSKRKIESDKSSQPQSKMLKIKIIKDETKPQIMEENNKKIAPPMKLLKIKKESKDKSGQKTLEDYYDGLPLSLLRAKKSFKKDRQPLSSISSNIIPKEPKRVAQKRKYSSLEPVWVPEDYLPLCAFLGSTKPRRQVSDSKTGSYLLCQVAQEQINTHPLNSITVKSCDADCPCRH